MKWLALPAELDSGHPPLLGYYLAVLWHLFGKTLAVSHWSMFPFIWLLVYLPLELSKALGQAKWGWLLLVLIWADPVLLGQSVLVSPDLMVAAGFFAVVYGWKAGRRAWIIGGALLLCSSSLRGMMTCAALGLWVVLSLVFQKANRKAYLQVFSAFIPGGLVGVGFLLWHYLATGWVGHFEGSTWSAAFQRVDGLGFLKNILVLGWRWVDFGRLAEWGVVVFALLKARRSLRSGWWLLLACLVFFLSPSALLYANLSAHRYFLPLFLGFHILIWELIIMQKWAEKTKKSIGIATGIVLVTGNLWIYPKGISMDWDATLAHRPYPTLRVQALQYLDSLKVDYSTVGSAFPNLNSGEMLLLNGDQRKFEPLNFEQNEWVMASNIFNDLDLPEYAVLESHWDLVQEWKKRGVWIQLFRKKGQAGK